eukprot:429703_1
MTAAIVRFNNGPPPQYDTTTNDFVQLDYWKQVSTIAINCICVAAGDYIGILGYRGTVNSYGAAPHISSIDGHSVTFARMGMQFNLVTYAPRDIWSQVDSSIGRVQFTYTTCRFSCPCLPGPTAEPSISPSTSPSSSTLSPSYSPSKSPTINPSKSPTDSTNQPSNNPSVSPTTNTSQPTKPPTKSPTNNPSIPPTK